MRRAWEHKEKIRGGFTAKYGVDQLVWWEAGAGREGALIRERQIKRWNRAWKIELIERFNPGWRDLYERLVSNSVLPRESGDPGSFF